MDEKETFEQQREEMASKGKDVLEEIEERYRLPDMEDVYAYWAAIRAVRDSPYAMPDVDYDAMLSFPPR